MTPSSDTNSVTMILPIGVDSPAYRFEWQIEFCFESEPNWRRHGQQGFNLNSESIRQQAI
jgi:hypothetical protein